MLSKFLKPPTALVSIYLLLTAAFITKLIAQETFVSLAVLWTVGYFLLTEHDTISEIAAGQFRIKRNVQAAKEVLAQVEQIEENLKLITRLSIENAFILGNTSLLGLGGDKPARERLELNLDQLSALIEEDKAKEQEYWSSLKKDLFPNRDFEDKSNR